MKDIRIDILVLNNWKCFRFKTVKFDSRQNLYEQENGYGKSSIFQAIIYCLYGVLPTTDSSSLKNDKNKPIVLELTMKDIDTNETFTIKKEIISATVKNFFYRGSNETDFKKVTSKQLNDICNTFCGTKSLFPLIWSQEPIYNSPVFDINYIKNNVLESEFEDSNNLDSIIRKEKLALVRQLNPIKSKIESLNNRDIDSEIKKLEEDRKNLVEELKDSTKGVSLDVGRAIACINAKEKLNELKNNFTGTLYDIDQISEYNNLNMSKAINEKIIKEYSENTSQIIDKFKIFNKSYVNGIIIKNYEDETCPICGSYHSFKDEFGVDFAKDLINSLSKSIYSEEQVEHAKESLERLNEFNANDIKISKEIYDLTLKACDIENPEEIIEADKKAKKDKWKELDKIDLNIQNLKDLKIDYSKYLELQNKIKMIDIALKVISKYIVEKTNVLIGAIIFEATKILSEVDKKYISLYYDLEENCFVVCMKKNDDIKTLPHNLLSSGEKSLLALALTMSYRKILREKKHIPSFILLDESLSSLDKDHLDKCFRVIKNSDCQSLIVNHN